MILEDKLQLADQHIIPKKLYFFLYNDISTKIIIIVDSYLTIEDYFRDCVYKSRGPGRYFQTPTFPHIVITNEESYFDNFRALLSDNYNKIEIILKPGDKILDLYKKYILLK